MNNYDTIFNLNIVDIQLIENNDSVECPICLRTIPSNSMHKMNCCKNRLCFYCYSKWHISQKKFNCVFCRNIEINEALFHDYIDIDTRQIDDSTHNYSHSLLSCKLCVCVFASCCVWVLYSIIICIYKLVKK